MVPIDRTSGHSIMLLSNPYTRDSRVRNEVRALVRSGWRVTVIAWDRTGEHAPSERLDGARIIRLRNTRLMRLCRFDLLRLGPWCRRAAAAACALHREDPADLIHAHDLDTLPGALHTKRTTGLPVLYDAHEIWGYMIAKDLPSVFVRHYLRKEKRLVAKVDRIVTVSQPILDHLAPHTKAPIDLVLNAKQPVARLVPPPDGPFRCVYIGVLNRTRRVLELIEGIGGIDGCVLEIAGYGPPRYVAAVEEAAKRHTNVTYLGILPNEQVLPHTQTAHLVACLFDPEDPLTRIGLPNKVFEAMATGRPTLATTGTYLGTFVTDRRIGAAVRPEPDAIRAQVEGLRDTPGTMRQMGERAYALAQGQYGWSAQETRLLQAYRLVVGQEAPTL